MNNTWTLIYTLYIFLERCGKCIQKTSRVSVSFLRRLPCSRSFPYDLCFAAIDPCLCLPDVRLSNTFVEGSTKKLQGILNRLSREGRNVDGTLLTWKLVINCHCLSVMLISESRKTKKNASDNIMTMQSYQAHVLNETYWKVSISSAPIWPDLKCMSHLWDTNFCCHVP